MKKIVGVLRGGIYENYERSISEGGKIISFIYENLFHKWKPVDILVDKNGIWHLSGLPIEPASLMNNVNIVWNTAHPSYTKVLSDLSISNIGVNNFLKVLESKDMLKEHMKKIGIDMPRAFVIPAYQEDFDGDKYDFAVKKAKEIHEKFTSPWIVKSLVSDSSMGIHVANTYPELIDAIFDCIEHNKSILVEELISGQEISMHSVSGFRGQEIYSFPAVGSFSIKEKEKLGEISKDIHKYLGISDYLNSSFVVHPKRGIFLKDIEFSPDLSNDSHFYKSSKYIGSNPKQVIDHILENSIRK